MKQVDDEYNRDCALRGIEIMTAWAGNPSNTEFMRSHLETIIHGEGFDGVNRALMGLINVAGCALAELEARTGKSVSKLLEEYAVRFTKM